MLNNLLKKVFGSRNDRLIKQYFQTVATINALETRIAALTDAELRAKTEEFRQRIADGTTLDALLPRYLPWYAKLANGCSGCVISTFS